MNCITVRGTHRARQALGSGGCWRKAAQKSDPLGWAASWMIQDVSCICGCIICGRYRCILCTGKCRCKGKEVWMVLILNQEYHCGHIEGLGREMLTCMVKEHIVWTLWFCWQFIFSVFECLKKFISSLFLKIFSLSIEFYIDTFPPFYSVPQR